MIGGPPGSTRVIESSAAQLDAAKKSIQTARSNLVINRWRNVAGAICLTRAARAPFIGSAW
jgi:hypothetical protein